MRLRGGEPMLDLGPSRSDCGNGYRPAKSYHAGHQGQHAQPHNRAYRPSGKVKGKAGLDAEQADHLLKAASPERTLRSCNSWTPIYLYLPL